MIVSRFRAGKWLAFELCVIVLLGAIAVALSSFSGGKEEGARAVQEGPAAKQEQRVTIENGESVIKLDAEAQEKYGIKTMLLTNAPQQQLFKAYGTVVDPRPLTELASGLADAKSQVATAKAKLAAAKVAFDRAKKLNKEQQNISTAQLEAAEAEDHVDEAALDVARTKLATLTSEAAQDWGPVVSQALTADTPLLKRLIGQEDVLLRITVPSGWSAAKPPLRAFALLDGQPPVPLTFLSRAAKADPRIQGADFFYTAPSQGALLPGANVEAALAGADKLEAALVPASAVVWWQGRAWGWFRTGPGSFTRRQLMTALPAKDGGYLVTALPDKTEIVVQGAQMLLSEEVRPRTPAGEDDSD